ncbi:ribosomal protection tetracycline resistance protein [Pedococcus dokdonensis]|uniref:Ribosomal protection tetracycline resistance protein n=1 Tax=Pedococcus dokdonensis TaxID=443156 RepID=A0A1H0T4Y3_9MICO|nr:TetM/TetW/TetO/TetS family tetracycline resistance ribosomal protection protein [Pedococcus dokdonensis]SDP48895.1 ribosomal protection tetracycline resistance protein [Pedococcus dokdonensis]
MRAGSKTLSLGIVAHVDAGKTSLTERVLYEAGVLDHPGSVDAGDTQTDSMALERRRGITIRSAVVSFDWRSTTLNLIDTPGHSDFIAEVERALTVLDAAVLVVSAVEGVQAQTLVLMRALQRLALPVVLFVNKVDRAGADPDRVLEEITTRLGPEAFALGQVTGAGTRDAAYLPFEVGAAELGELRRTVRAAAAHPVLFGSAITGAGVTDLLDTLATLLPGSAPETGTAPRGTVFKVDRTDGGRTVLARVRTGSLRVRDRVELDGRPAEKVTGLRLFDRGRLVPVDEVRAGRIAAVSGWSAARIGDRFGDRLGAGDRSAGRAVEFSRPTLETVVDAVRPEDVVAMYAALTELADQDPLIDLRRDDGRREVAVSLYGEVQKEVIAAVLADEYGVEVTFRPTTSICVERLTGVGSAAQLIGVSPNPFLAQVGLRVEPLPVGAGHEFALEIELGSMPPAFFTAVREGIDATLEEGVHGWAVPDARVVMTHSGYYPRQSHSHATFDKAMSSTAQDFRSLTRLVLAEALVEAGTVVCAPIHRFELEVPEDTLSSVLGELSRHRAVPLETTVSGRSALLAGEVPADAVHGVQQRIPHLTRGEGVFTSGLDHYAPTTGPAPTRGRARPDPFAQIGDWTRIQRSWPAG